MMRRDSFERESAFLGKDFSARIKEVGGKAAGLEILQKALDLWGFWNFGVPDYYVIPPEYYLRAEERLKNDETIDDIAQEAFEICRRYFTAFGKEGDWEDYFHVRSSSLIEDFVDDRYFGTFQSYVFTSFLTHIGRRHEGIWKEFYRMKTEYKEHFQLPEDEALAVIVMKSYATRLGLENLKHATIYSHYPEARELGAVVELCEHNTFFNYEPLQLLFVKDGTVSVHHAVQNNFTPVPFDSFEVFREKAIADWGKTYVKRHVRHIKQLYQEMLAGDTFFMRTLEQRDSAKTYKKYPYIIDGEHTSICKERLEEVVRFAQKLEDILGYEVNLEAMIGEDSVSLLQCRPVPRLEQRAVTSLEPLSSNRHLVTETPFVFGSFRAEGRLVYPERKGPYPSHRFSEPVIVWNDNQWCKGIRYWDNDPLALAILNPQEGTALTHGYNLIPPFGETRNKFSFLGLPGFAEKFLSHMTDEHVRRETLYGEVLGNFRYTPYSLLLESDGRRGRVSVLKEFAHFFT